MSVGGRVLLHASCVASDGKALLILGPSGSGKSALALELMALGAALLADDQTEVERVEDGLIARCPSALSGLIEARGIGILRAAAIPEARVVLAVDLGQRETQRLPQSRNIPVLGWPVDLVLGQEGRHFSSALLLRLRSGRVA